MLNSQGALGVGVDVHPELPDVRGAGVFGTSPVSHW